MFYSYSRRLIILTMDSFFWRKWIIHSCQVNFGRRKRDLNSISLCIFYMDFLVFIPHFTIYFKTIKHMSLKVLFDFITLKHLLTLIISKRNDFELFRLKCKAKLWYVYYCPYLREKQILIKIKKKKNIFVQQSLNQKRTEKKIIQNCVFS